MPRYRKKPVEIDAWQSFDDCGTYTCAIPHWILEACSSEVIFTKDGKTFIKTLEGDMRVSDGDWIIRGVKGELYPCKDEIFKLTYEAV